MFRSALGLLLILGLVAGCGSSSGPKVSGTVVCDGKPVEQGSISFEPVDKNGPSAGAPIKDGKFELAGDNVLLPGEKTVRIQAVLKTGKQIEAGRPAPPGTMVDEVKTVTPPPETVTIKADDKNEFTFDFTSTGKK